MLFRLQNFNEVDVYRYFNINHPGWPDSLPPPPNPDKLRSFVVWALNESIAQENEANDPKAQQGRRPMTP